LSPDKSVLTCDETILTIIESVLKPGRGVLKHSGPVGSGSLQLHIRLRTAPLAANALRAIGTGGGQWCFFGRARRMVLAQAAGKAVAAAWGVMLRIHDVRF